MKKLYVNWFNSPAQLVKFVYKNRIKSIVSINRTKDNRLELWFYSKQIWSNIYEDKGE